MRKRGIAFSENVLWHWITDTVRHYFFFLIRHGSSGLPEVALAGDCFKGSHCHWAI